MNIFLHPFCLKLHKCFQDGINWLHPQTKIYNTKIFVPLIIADAPARVQILNTILTGSTVAVPVKSKHKNV